MSKENNDRRYRSLSIGNQLFDIFLGDCCMEEINFDAKLSGSDVRAIDVF